METPEIDALAQAFSRFCNKKSRLIDVRDLSKAITMAAEKKNVLFDRIFAVGFQEGTESLYPKYYVEEGFCTINFMKFRELYQEFVDSAISAKGKREIKKV